MGFNYRRSKKIGPFIFNFSSGSGLGVSFGWGPFRIGRSGKGRKTVSARGPIRGLSYRKNIK